MRKLMVEFLTIFENRGIKIATVDYHKMMIMTKSINLEFFSLILYRVGVRFDQRRFSANCPFIEKTMI